jgi:alkylation response protein AidB-like acyl-CoA dehydrogenase
MPIDLNFDDDDEQFAATVGRFCQEHVDPVESSIASDGSMDRTVWTALAELGVLGLATPEGGGTASTMAAVMGQLGRHFVGGPLASTFAATQLLPPAERKAVVAGESIVTVGNPPLLPWAPVADLFIELAGDHAWLAVPVSTIEPVNTLGGEPWGRCLLRRDRDLGRSQRAVAFSDCALAAYLVGAGEVLLDTAATYARDRAQFGRAIGEFQAVSHPLADCAVHLSAASVLAKLAADSLDRQQADSRQVSAVARLSAGAAALRVAYQAHQTLGAMGFTVEGPVGSRSARIRQLTLLPPAPAEVREAVLAGLFR